MEKKDKLSYASPKSKLNGVVDGVQPMGGFWGTGTGSGCGTISTGISGEENIQVSHSFGGITWNGFVNVSYSATLKRKTEDGITSRSASVDYVNISYNLSGDCREEESEKTKTVLEGNSVFGSVTYYSDSSSVLGDVTFTVSARELVKEGEEWREVSSRTESETKRISFSIDVIDDYDATINVSFN